MVWQSGHNLGTALCWVCTRESLRHAKGSFWASSRARPCRHGSGRHQSWTGRTGPCSSAVSARVHGDRDRGMGVVRLRGGLVSNVLFWEDHQDHQVLKILVTVTHSGSVLQATELATSNWPQGRELTTVKIQFQKWKQPQLEENRWEGRDLLPAPPS